MDLIQQNLNIPRVDILLYLILDGKCEKIGSYNSSVLSPIPEIGEEIQIPKIPQDKSENNGTVCTVIKKRHNVPLGQMFVPVILLYLSLGSSDEK